MVCKSYFASRRRCATTLGDFCSRCTRLFGTCIAETLTSLVTIGAAVTALGEPAFGSLVDASLGDVGAVGRLYLAKIE